MKKRHGKEPFLFHGVCLLYVFSYMLYQLWQETGNNQDNDAKDEHGNGLGRTSLPFLQDNAPYIGEHHVECHEDAERQGHQCGRLCEEAFAE